MESILVWFQNIEHHRTQTWQISEGEQIIMARIMINPLWENGNIMASYELSENVVVQHDWTDKAVVAIVLVQEGLP